MSLNSTAKRKAALTFKRLETLPFVPHEAAYKALFEVFCDLVADEAHAERAVNALLEEPLGANGEQRWPTGYDIRQAANRTRLKCMAPTPDCRDCGGMGFGSERRIVNGVPYDYSTGRCHCWRDVPVEEAVCHE